MSLLKWLTNVFVDVFGITHPEVAKRDLAVRYIALLLAGLMIAGFAVIVFGLRVIR